MVPLRAGGRAHRALVLPLHRVRRRNLSPSPARIPSPPRLLQAVLAGLLLPWLTYRLARRMLASPSPEHRRGSGAQERGPGGEVVPLLAAFLAAIYAYFILYGAMVQTEAFYICALLWSLERALALGKDLRLRPRLRPSGDPGLNLNLNLSLSLSLTLGLSLGVATLLRQSILPWAAVLFAWLLWQGYRGGNLRRALASTLTSALVLALCILPFTIRNYRAYGDFLLLNANAGYAMYSAQSATACSTSSPEPCRAIGCRWTLCC